MNKSKVYIRTELGDSLLGVPYGNVSGDAKRLLALIDGSSSVEAITEKVPLSVQVQLETIFAQLLTEGLIAEKAGYADQEAYQQAYQQTVKLGFQSKADDHAPNEVETENRRRIDLERELAEVRTQLSESKARQREVEAVCRRLEQKVSAFEHDRLVKSAENLLQPPLQADTGVELHDSLDTLNELNQALLDQQEILDSTLKLRSFQMQLDSQPHQHEIEVKKEKEAHLHPDYKKLRGLEFFKGFANAELLHFLDIAKWQKGEAGDTILNEGDMGMPFFIIVSGSVKVIRKTNLMAILGAGDFFGEFAYLSGGEPLRSAQVVAAGDCELLVVEPMDVEFSSVQMRLNVVEALLRGQVKRALLSSRRIDNLLSHIDVPDGHEPL
ncbi:MAG: cyclic nucleotide-binding domain-containing protein [Gallionella sp.]